MSTQTVRLAALTIFALFVVGCAHQNATCWITERDVRLIGIAREAAVLNGYSTEDAIYEVSRSGNGWRIEAGKSPGYTGKGEPAILVDLGFSVTLDASERPTEIVSFGTHLQFKNGQWKSTLQRFMDGE